MVEKRGASGRAYTVLGRDVSVMLADTGVSNDAQIPEIFVVNELHRPSLSLSVPKFGSSRNRPRPTLVPNVTERVRLDVVSTLLTAAKEWGFFQVVNHGVPIELLKSKSRMVKGIGCMWLERITLRSILAEPSAERFASRVWPGGNPAFSDTVREVGRELEALKHSILELLAEGLGLSTNYFTWPFDELKAAGQANLGADLRINYYPVCAQPSLALGTRSHTDPILLTLLYQDTGNGLQILDKTGSSWHLIDYKRDGDSRCQCKRAADKVSNTFISRRVIYVGAYRMVLADLPSLVDFLAQSASLARAPHGLSDGS